MTDVQRELINAMRHEGKGYRYIARSLNLTESSVEQFCARHGLAGHGSLVKLNVAARNKSRGLCMVCGKPIDQNQRGRKRQFCSAKCRTAYWRMKKEAEEVWAR